jgi:PAS domain S-box-containing protein
MIRALLNTLWFRLLLGFAVPLVLFLAAATVSYFTMQRLLDSLNHEQLSQKKLTNISEARENLEAMASAKLAHHLLGLDEFVKEFNDRHKEFLRDDLELRELLQRNEEQTARLVKIQKLEAAWYDLSMQSFKQWPKHSNNGGVDASSTALIQQGIDLLKKIREVTNELVQHEYTQLGKLRLDVHRRTAESIWAIVAALLVSVGLSVALTVLLWRGISAPIQHLGAAVYTMRQGRYEAVTPYGPTEIAELMRGFNLMGLALRERTTLLESNELRYRTVVGTTSSLIWTTDVDGRNSEMTNWCALTGQKPEDIAGDGWLQAIHPDDRNRFSAHWQQVLRDKIYAEEEVRIRRAEGTYGDYLCRSIPIFDSKGEVVEWVRICADITERRREEELRRQKEAAEAANRAKSDFLTKMSHELRTPLNAIIGMSKMLRTRRFGTVNEKQLDYLTDISQAGQHLLSLINDILDLSKVETGRMELKSEPLPINETVEQVVSTVRALAESKSLRLQTEPCEPNGVITTDPGRFKQVLYNLLSNAVKFTPAGGSVRVRCSWADKARPDATAVPQMLAQAVRVDVQDTGIGIGPEDQLKLGTEFFQVPGSPHKAQEGTGLGLALSRRLMNMMGGRLWFTSAVGKGSTFSFAVPMVPARPGFSSPTASGEGPLVAIQDHRPLVLLIDDHVPTNKLLSDWLQEAGLRTASAYDGHTGLELARRLTPRLILLDMRLPGMSGVDVLHQLKENSATARIPVIVISVMEGREHFQELDVVDWFVKPFDKEQLIERLQKTLPSLFTPEQTVLIVEDDPQARKWMRDTLLAEGLHVREAGSAAEALELISADRPDLLVLDLLMPGTNGFQMVQTVRANPDWQQIPIMIVTAKDISAGDRARLGSYLQAIFRKDHFTREMLLDRMQQLGVNIAAATSPADTTPVFSGKTTG